MSQYVKQKYADALEHLLVNQKLSNITVTQLSAECGLSRRSFYNNFADIYDFIFSVHLMRLQDVSDTYWTDRDYYNAVRSSLENIKKYRVFYKELIRTQGQNSFYNSLLTFLMSVCQHLIPQPASEEVLFCLELYLSGFAHNLCKWIERDMDIAAEKLAQYVQTAIPDPLKCYFTIKKN